MVYGFATQSGGGLELVSTEGEGTKACIYLPVGSDQNAEAGVLKKHSAKGLAADHQRTVLLVEDDSTVREVVKQMLNSLGYNIVEADSAEPALDILKSGLEVDLLFTDVVLRDGLTGFELAGQARELQPELRVLYTSGYPGTTIDGDMVSPGRILKKPYRREELVEAMDEALAN